MIAQYQANDHTRMLCLELYHFCLRSGCFVPAFALGSLRAVQVPLQFVCIEMAITEPWCAERAQHYTSSFKARQNHRRDYIRTAGGIYLVMCPCVHMAPIWFTVACLSCSLLDSLPLVLQQLTSFVLLMHRIIVPIQYNPQQDTAVLMPAFNAHQYHIVDPQIVLALRYECGCSICYCVTVVGAVCACMALPHTHPGLLPWH